MINLKLALTKLERIQAMNRNFNDQEVVAAINSCIDFEKLTQLERNVITRFKELLKYRRIGAVCFFTEVGFGLRVYRDHISIDATDADGGDEVDLEKVKFNNDGRSDLEGLWMRCAKEVYHAKIQKQEYLVIDKKGKTFLGEEEEEESSTTVLKWGHSRVGAKVFTDKGEAERTAALKDGFVVDRY